MDCEDTVNNAIKNMAYYVSLIQKSVRTQLKTDIEKGEKAGINTRPGSIRFDALCCIDSSATRIEDYIENIKSNLGIAIKQDKILFPPAQDPQEPEVQQEENNQAGF